MSKRASNPGKTARGSKRFDRPTAQIVVRAAAVVIVRAFAGLLLVSSLLWLFALGGVDGTSLWWIGGVLGVVLVAALAPPTRRAGRAVNWGRHR